jgi:hypothetical protein
VHIFLAVERGKIEGTCESLDSICAMPKAIVDKVANLIQP